jgi:hypothetical protein
MQAACFGRALGSDSKYCLFCLQDPKLIRVVQIILAVVLGRYLLDSWWLAGSSCIVSDDQTSATKVYSHVVVPALLLSKMYSVLTTSE